MVNSLRTKLNLKQVINASGRMSILGVSSPTKTVMEAMKLGGEKYFEMDDLIEKSGEYITKLLGSESAVIVNSASSGIALSIAGLITRGNHRKSIRLHQEPNESNEII